MKRTTLIITLTIITAAVIAATAVVVGVGRGGIGSNTQSTKGILSSSIALLDANDTPKLSSADSILRFDRDIADLGRMKVGDNKDVVFKFKNVGSIPVVIISIVTTCGCTSAEYEKKPLMPNGRSEIRVRFEAAEVGAFFKKLSVYYAGGTSPIEIAIKGEVR